MELDFRTLISTYNSDSNGQQSNSHEQATDLIKGLSLFLIGRISGELTKGNVENRI